MFDGCVEQGESGERRVLGDKSWVFIFFTQQFAQLYFNKKWNVSIRRLQCMNVNVCVNANCSVRHSEWSEPLKSAVFFTLFIFFYYTLVPFILKTTFNNSRGQKNASLSYSAHAKIVLKRKFNLRND